MPIINENEIYITPQSDDRYQELSRKLNVAENICLISCSTAAFILSSPFFFNSFSIGGIVLTSESLAGAIVVGLLSTLFFGLIKKRQLDLQKISLRDFDFLIQDNVHNQKLCRTLEHIYEINGSIRLVELHQIKENIKTSISCLPDDSPKTLSGQASLASTEQVLIKYL